MQGTLPNPRSQRFTPISSFKSLINLAFNFRSRIHFGLIFVCGVRLTSNFILFHVDGYPGIQRHLLQLCVFLNFAMSLVCGLSLKVLVSKFSSERLRVSVFGSVHLCMLCISSCFWIFSALCSAEYLRCWDVFLFSKANIPLTIFKDKWVTTVTSN